MPITTNIASSNLPHSLQHYAMKFVSDLQIIWWSLSVICGRSVVFSRYSDSSTNKTDLHNMTEILFKVALYTITLSLFRSAIISVLQLSLFRSAFNSEAIQFPHISPSQCHLFILLNLSWKYRNWYTAYLMLNDNQSINQSGCINGHLNAKCACYDVWHTSLSIFNTIVVSRFPKGTKYHKIRPPLMRFDTDAPFLDWQIKINKFSSLFYA